MTLKAAGYVLAVTALLVWGAWALPGAVAEGVTGAWSFTVDLDTGRGSVSFVFRQDDEQLTGSYDGAYGSAEVIGTVQDEDIEFSFEVEGGKVTYVGKILGRTMEGTCDYGEVAGAGTWEATRGESSFWRM